MTFFRCILLTGILASGWNDYDIALFEKYRLIRTNAYTVMICNSEDDLIIPPKITGLGVKRNLIYGVCEKIKESDIEGVSGYFLVDTQKSIVKVGLTKEVWLAELKKYGILKEPVLKKPSKYWNIINNLTKVIWLSLLWLIFVIMGIIYYRKIMHRKSKQSQISNC
jgi:hypothetical protein